TLIHRICVLVLLARLWRGARAVGFGVSAASAVKGATSGSAAAKPMGGRRACILADEEAWLVARLEACPHPTVRSLADELRTWGFDVSHNAV
ncbi:MAG: hypothetical protein AB7O43_23095, partial [Hyphomicrobiaceae bacterium]